MQKLLNCSQVLIEYFYDYLVARVIGFLAMYHDGELCATYHNSRHYWVKICLFGSVMLLHFYFWAF